MMYTVRVSVCGLLLCGNTVLLGWLACWEYPHENALAHTQNKAGNSSDSTLHTTDSFGKI